MAQQVGTYPSFSSMKRLGVFLHLPGWDASTWQGTHLYPLAERGTMKVKCLAKEHNTVIPARVNPDSLIWKRVY